MRDRVAEKAQGFVRALRKNEFDILIRVLTSEQTSALLGLVMAVMDEEEEFFDALTQEVISRAFSELHQDKP